jgi:polyferredoxin
MTPSPTARVRPWRLAVQALLALAFVAAPLLRVGGRPLFGLDAREGVFFLFGLALRASNLLPLLAVTLALLFGLLWIAASLGRLWCGWFCPQSLFCDAMAWARRRWGRSGTVALHVGAALASLLLAVATLLYVIPAERFFAEAGAGWIAALALGSLLYADTAFVGRTLCKVACPYGKLLTILTDPQALTVELDPAVAQACIRCAACERCCPMDVRVREGAGGDCIRCGRCIDACAAVMERQKPPHAGLIRFATPGGGSWGVALGKPRALLLLFLSLLAAGVFVWLAASPDRATLQVRLTPTAMPRALADGRTAVFVTVSVRAPAGDYALRAQEGVELKGDVGHIAVGADGGAHLSLAAVVAGTGEGEVRFALTRPDGSVAAQARLPLGGVAKGPDVPR